MRGLCVATTPHPFEFVGLPLCPLPQGRKGRGHKARAPAAGAFWPNEASGRNTNLRVCETIAGPDPLFRDCYLQWMAQLQRVEPSVRGGIPTMPWAVLAPAERGRSASGAFRPTKPGGKTAVTIRPGARPHNPNERWRPSLSHPRGTKKPPAGCPAGGGQLKSSHEHQGTMSRWTRMRSP